MTDAANPNPTNPAQPPIDGAVQSPAIASPAIPPVAPTPASASKASPYGKAQRNVSPAPAVEAKPEKPAANRALAMAKANTARLTAELESTRAQTKELDAYKKVLSGHASVALNALPKEWQEHIKKQANGDPRRELELVNETAHLRGTVAPAAPASTTNATSPKPQVEGDADVASARQYNEMKKAAPGRAAALYLTGRAAIDRGLKKLATVQ